MKNGNVTDFIDKLYLGEELLFEYKGYEYFIQGWNEGPKAIMALDRYSNVPFEEYVWKVEKDKMSECAEAFLNAEIWDNSSFLQIQGEVNWKD